MMDYIQRYIKWANDNQGAITVAVFGATIFLGWISGIFRALRNKPEFRIEVLDGPTFCSTFATGKKYEGYDTHRTGIAVYLNVANIGSAPASIEKVSLGYKWHLNKFNWLWLRYRLFWFWMRDPITSLDDFKYDFGDRIKVYPFLLQYTTGIMREPNAYLLVGQSTNGIVYFEQKDSWGGCFPSPKNGETKVKLRIRDSFGGTHSKIARIPIVSLEEAKKYCSVFGQTFEMLKNRNSEND